MFQHQGRRRRSRCTHRFINKSRPRKFSPSRRGAGTRQQLCAACHYVSWQQSYLRISDEKLQTIIRLVPDYHNTALLQISASISLFTTHIRSQNGGLFAVLCDLMRVALFFVLCLVSRSFLVSRFSFRLRLQQYSVKLT
jgi:hypothetical protein